MPQTIDIEANLKAVTDRIGLAARDAGRPPTEVTLVAGGDVP